jgi:hypothetical protein
VVLPDVIELIAGLDGGGTFTLAGREVFEDLTATQGANVVFLYVQELPLILKAPLNAAYMFLYPFLSIKHAFAGDHFDLRSITMNLIVPMYSFWLNAWFISGAITKVPASSKYRQVVIATLAGLILIGIYSLQTRHKTIIYPLYYLVVVAGLKYSPPNARIIGYICSVLFIALQVISNVR